MMAEHKSGLAVLHSDLIAATAPLIAVGDGGEGLAGAGRRILNAYPVSSERLRTAVGDGERSRAGGSARGAANRSAYAFSPCSARRPPHIGGRALEG